MLAVHVTHEAAHKFGGIGAVLSGLITSKSYRRRFPQTLLYGPLFEPSPGRGKRLGDDGRVLYSSLDAFDAVGRAALFGPIQERRQVNIVYGQRSLADDLNPQKTKPVEVILVDVTNMEARGVDEFKYRLWEHFGLNSARFEDWDYEQYLRLAIPYLDILEACFPDQPVCHLGHEYMGLPCLLEVVMAQRGGVRRGDKTYFYAHEVAPARAVVESLPGHEVAFDNVMRLSLTEGRTLEHDFGSQEDNYRAELVKRVEFLDGVLAVSDNIKDQLLYFQPRVDAAKVHVVYNGFTFQDLTRSQKIQSRRLIEDYTEILLNFRPEYIITHVTRLVVSKGCWRDVKLLYRLDDLLARRKLKGVFFLLATFASAGRSSEAVKGMEAEYGWPVLHKDGWPDLVGPEVDMYYALTLFNARSWVLKGVFINQFGFSRHSSGLRVPEDASRLDLRAASDLELGLSVYEPFGIAQLETYAYGGVPFLSRACGCSYLLQQVAPEKTFRIVDFSKPPSGLGLDLNSRQALLDMTILQRDAIEEAIVDQEAEAVFRLIYPPKREERRRIMGRAAPQLGWEATAERVVTALA